MSSNFEKNTKGFSFTAIFLIFLGIVFLLNNFGILSWNLWQNLWKFWPILLILFGTEIILGRNFTPRGLGFLIVLIFIVPVILILNPFTGNPLATQTALFKKPLANLTKASINFNLASSNLKISELEPISTDLFLGTLKYSQLLPKPNLTEEQHFGEAQFTISQSSKDQIPFSNNLGNSGIFSLTRLIPLELNFKGSTAVLELNLEKLRISFLDVETEAGNIDIRFAKDYSTRAFLKTKASLIKLKIPENTAASIKLNSSFKTLKIDSNKFKKIDSNTYKSTNFDQASNKIEVEISGSVSSIEIN